MNNLSSYCGLVDAKIRASDKDLSVIVILYPILAGFSIQIYGVCKFQQNIYQ